MIFEKLCYLFVKTRKVFCLQLQPFYRTMSSNISSQDDNEKLFTRKELNVALKHLFDGSELNVYDDKIINLGVGAPGPDLLKKCCDLFKKATDHRMDVEFKSNAYLFQYGPTSGTLEVRTAFASFLSEAYNDKVFKEDLIITTGATHGMHLILSTLIDMNGIIFVDDVTYMIALDAFKQFTNMKIISVKLNDDGTDVIDLEESLKKYKFKSKNKLFWGIYYTIPTYHNPTGILFSEEKCKILIQLARKYEILIACDDVYNMLYYNDNKSPKRLYSYDNLNDNNYCGGNVISNGTFSKIIAPGIRLGWMECSQKCIKNFINSGILKSGGCTNNYTSGLLTTMIEFNLIQSHINMMLINYKLRMNSFCNILKNNLPLECKYIKPNGGYFIWIQLPNYINSNEFNKFCIENYQIFTIPGDRFSINENFKNYLRISIAFHCENVLIDAAKRLCNALNIYINQYKNLNL